MPEEIRQRILSRYDKNGDGKLDAEETKAWKEGMARRAAGGGGGGRGGFGGGGSSSSAPQSKTAYRLEMVEGAGGQKTQMLVPIELKLGITDGSVTEIKEGLNDGDEVVIGLLNPPPSSTAPGGSTANRPTNPFGGGPPGMRPR
jgi:HlyD family secretion protein